MEREIEIQTAIELAQLGLEELDSFDDQLSLVRSIEEIRSLKDRYLAGKRLIERSVELLAVPEGPPFFLSKTSNSTPANLVLEAVRRLCGMKDHECSRETIHSCVDYSIAAVRAGLKELVESKVLRQEGIGRKAKYSLISDAEDRVAT